MPRSALIGNHGQRYRGAGLMPGFGFGSARSPRAMLGSGGTGAGPDGPTVSLSYGALSRNQFGAGFPVSANAILSGDAGGHWEISAGRIYPSPAGDAADLNAGPYALLLDDGSRLNITIEPDTWDVTDQSEWSVIANQSATALRGKTIALRNTSPLNLGITGAFGTPFRRVDLRDTANGNRPLMIKGRLGAPGAFADYCEIDRVEQLRGTRGVTFCHLKTTPVAQQKFRFVGESSNHCEDIVIDDCWVRGASSDPNGDFSNSSNYPNLGIDLIATTGTLATATGNITITNSKVEWAGSGINITVGKVGHTAIVTDNEIGFFYDDALAISTNPANPCAVIATGNFIHDSMGIATDSGNPHVDAIRLIATPSFTADWVDVTIEDNIILQGTARGDMQGIFLDDFKTNATDSGHHFGGTVRNNIVGVSKATQALFVGQAKNCTVENNTVFSYNEVFSVQGSPGIGVAPSGGATSANGGGNLVRNNITDNLSAPGATLTNNFVAGLAGATIAYSALFDGPTFAPASEAEAKLQMNPKVAAGAIFAP